MIPPGPMTDVRPARRDLNAEARTQAAIIAWARVVAPQVLCFHIPNGGLRTEAGGGAP